MRPCVFGGDEIVDRLCALRWWCFYADDCVFVHGFGPFPRYREPYTSACSWCFLAYARHALRTRRCVRNWRLLYRPVSRYCSRINIKLCPVQRALLRNSWSDQRPATSPHIVDRFGISAASTAPRAYQISSWPHSLQVVTRMRFEISPRCRFGR